MRRARLATLIAAAALCLTPPSARAQADPAAMAAEASAQLADAQVALQAADGARDRVRALTQTIEAYEGGLEALREGLRRASLRESAIRNQFDAERAELGQLLGVLLSQQSEPGALSTLHPAGPLGAARAGMMVADITPGLQAEVARIRSQLDEVGTLRLLQESAAETLKDGLAGVQQARTELSQAMSNRTDLPQRLLDDPDQLDRLIESAETLDGFATGLTEVALEGEAQTLPDLTDAMGTLPLPVNGTILRRAGEADAAGIRRPGWLIVTRPRALVTAPWPATIRYRGPLLDYGNVMILEPGSDVLLVLAGLDQVYGEVGQVIPAGTPVGLMGGNAPEGIAILNDVAEGGGTQATETLYIELRQGGSPVDPGTWFAETEDATR